MDHYTETGTGSQMGNKGKDPVGRSNIAMLLHGDIATDGRVQREISALTRSGYRVDLLCLSGEGSDFAPEGLTLRRAPLRRGKRRGVFRYIFEYGFFILWSGFALMVLHPRRRYESVIIHNMPNSLVVAALPLKLFGVKIILDVHDPSPEVFQILFGAGRLMLKRFLIREERFCVRRADGVLTVNQPMRELIAHRTGIQAVVIHNTPDAEKWGAGVKKERTGPDELRLVHHGHIHKRYGIHHAIEAVAALRGNDSRVILDILGRGPYLSELKSYAAELKVERECRFLGAFKPEDVGRLLLERDVGVAFYENSPFADLLLPVKILECATAGLPQIATRISGVIHYFGEDCIHLIETVEDIRRAILEIDRDYEAALEQAGKARERVLEIAWEREEKNFIEWYSGLTGHE